MQGVTRTSGLLAPTMLLTGHGAEVFSVKFSPDGQTVASGSHDKHIFLWNTYGECANFMLLKGGVHCSDHVQACICCAILEVAISKRHVMAYLI